MAYRKRRPTPTDYKVNKSYEGVPIETKIMKIMTNKEPIEDSADIIYTDRKDGVLPAYNIRTDRMEVALDAMDKVSATYIAQREARLKARVETKDSADTKTITSGETPANTSDKS